MEIRRYLQILARYWWIILLATIAAGVGSFLLVNTRRPVYTVSVRVSVGPAPTLTDTRSLIDLAGQSGYRYIAGTYAQYLTASTVKADAQRVAGVSKEDADNYSIQANVLPDTSVILVSASGPDAITVADYLNATIDASIKSTRNLYRVIELLPLEAALPPPKPTSPQPARDIPLGTGLGFGIGVILALLLDYLLGAQERRVEQKMVRIADTGPLSRLSGR